MKRIKPTVKDPYEKLKSVVILCLNLKVLVHKE